MQSRRNGNNISRRNGTRQNTQIFQERLLALWHYVFGASQS